MTDFMSLTWYLKSLIIEKRSNINENESELKPFYPELKVGSLTYEAGSLHCFNWDAKKWVVFNWEIS